jgi:hypothetical protein
MDNEPRPLLAHPGGRRAKGQKRADGLRYYGNSSAYHEARLTRDAAEGVRTAAILLAGVRSGVISLHAAACEMNYTKPRVPTGRGSENVSKRIAWAMHKLLNPKKKGPTQASGAEFSNKEESPNVSAPAKT